jgi:UDP-glucose 4-epimerase
MESKWLICGDGYLGRAFKELVVSLTVPESININLKYSHLASGDSLRSTAEWLEKMEPKFFLNASGPSNINDSHTNIYFYESEPLALVKAHIEILSKLKNPPVYVFLSSGAIYGETSILGAAESVSPNPISPYGVGKIRAEEYLSSVASSGITIVILRVFSTFSKGLTSRLPYVIRQRFSEERNCNFAGSGEELRDFVHTSDLVSATSRILGKALISPISSWNIASGTALSVREIVQIACNELGRRDNIFYTFNFNNKLRPFDPKILVANISKLRSIGFEPEISPREGLAEYFRQT